MDVASPLILDTFAVAASATGGSPPPNGDMAADAARFAQLMAEPAPVSAPGAVDPVPAVDGVQGVAPTSSFGDAILNGVSALGEGYTKSWQGVQASMKAGIAGGNSSPAGLIELQGSVAHWTLFVECATSCTKQGTQCISELTKLN